MRAHGGNARMVGKDLTELKDADGMYFVKKIMETAMSKSGEGWVDYRWANPTTLKLEPKTAFVMRFEPLVIGCSLFK